MSRAQSYGIVIILVAIVCISRPAHSQESAGAESESLSKPVTVPHEVGLYKGINSIPESLRSSKLFARNLYELQHYAGADGLDNTRARVEAFEQSKSDLLRSAMTSDKVAGSKLPVFSTAWTNIGPVNTAGCTKALAFDPTSGNTIYAGAAEGGVWKSRDAGASWTPLTDLYIPDLAIASIAVDPSAPNTIFAGSGDPSLATDGLPGTGLYRSTDAGATWAHVGTSNLTGTVNKVLVHPTNSNIVYACSWSGNTGLYRSTDGGVTFSRVFSSGTSVVWDVAAGEVVGGKLVMYLVEGYKSSSPSASGGIYKSLDEGATWSKLSNANLPTGTNFGKAALAIPNGDKTKIYCLAAKPDGNLLGLYKSVNSGTSFVSVTVPSTLFNPSGNGAQGWYDLYLAISPTTTTSDTLYIGGVEAYYSFNSGTNWHVYSDYSGTTSVHVDNQSIAIDPKNSRNVVIGTDGGVYRSTNAGQTWSYRSNGMATMRFYHIGLDNGDYLKTYGGAQDQGVWKLVSGQGPSFFFPGDGFQPIIDPTNSNTLYVELPFGEVFRSSNGASANFFSDISASQFIQSSSNYEQSDWSTPLAMAPNNHAILFEGRNHLWQTTTSGNSWNTISPAFQYGGSGYLVESIGLSPANSQVYWVGLQAGKIQLTTNGGSTWADKSTGLPGSNVRSIVCNPKDQNWALAAFETYGTSSARVMLTTNAGTSWTNVSGTGSNILPGVPTNCVALDSTSPTTVWYAATDNGMYYTRDAGATWSIAGSGIGLSPCWDVQIHSNKVTIRVGTHGRSIWEGNVNILPVELTGLVATKTSTGTKLDWKTDSERSNSGFYVERSYNYQPFEDIYFQPGAGNSNTEKSYSYFDPKTDDGYYIYRLNQIDLDGSSHLSNIVEVRFGSSGSALRLDQSFPNPFFLSESAAGSIRIRYALPNSDQVTMKIVSVSGVAVWTLIDHQQQSEGEQDAFWDGTDDAGKPVAAGVYYYVLETASGGKLWNKMILVGK